MDKQQIADILHSAIIEVSPFAADLLSGGDQWLDPDTILISLGINSIDYAQIVHIAMERLNVSCPLDVFTRTNSVSGIIDILYDMATGEHAGCARGHGSCHVADKMQAVGCHIADTQP